MDSLKQLLDESARLIIKKQNGEMMMAVEVEINGQEYHLGHRFQTCQELYQRWGEFVEYFLSRVQRKQKQLAQGVP